MVPDKLKYSSQDTPTVRLMKAMHFGGKDLDLNRAGELTRQQKIRLRQTRLDSWIFFFLFWVVVVMSAFIAAYQQEGGRFDTNFQPSTFLFLLLTSIVIGSVFLHRRWQQLKTMYVTAFTGQVKKHDGPAYNILLVIDYEQRATAIYSVNHLLRDAFIDGETYTLYSVSVSPNIILTAEHVPTRE